MTPSPDWYREQDRLWRAWLIPGTDVLRNLHGDASHPYGTTDPAELARLEAGWARRRMAQHRADPLPGKLDFDYMCRLHHRLFRDTYSWAGRPRNVWTNKMGPGFFPGDPPTIPYQYLPPHSISAAAHQIFTALEAKHYLVGLGKADFVSELARYWCQINDMHAYREGNTRSQCAYFWTLAADAGWTLRTGAFAESGELRQEFVNARFYYQRTRGDHERLGSVLNQIVTNPEPSRVTQIGRVLGVVPSVQERTSRRTRTRFSDTHQLPPEIPERGPEPPLPDYD